MRGRIAVLAVIAAAIPSASPAVMPTPAGLATDNVRWVNSLPYVTDAVGGELVGNYFYVTDQNKLTILDVTNPVSPVPVGVLPFAQEPLYAREDVDTNGEILLLTGGVQAYTEAGYDPLQLDLFVVDVRDKSNPRIVSRVPAGGGHTVSCAFDCTWAYSSDGALTDLRDPLNPVLRRRNRTDYPQLRTHDVEEIRPGLVMTASLGVFEVSATDDSATQVAAGIGSAAGNACWHSARWPRDGADRFALCSGESFRERVCNDSTAAFSTWDTAGWRETGALRRVATHRVRAGVYADGHPARNILTCSPHWFEPHPDFHDGGLVAAAWYEHGTRFLDIAADGTIAEVGWFVPFGGSTSAAYWITDEIVYAVDYQRGLDILHFSRAPQPPI